MDRCHRLVLAGCGGMGRRHLRGYGVLEDFEPGRIEVAAVIDPELARADFVAVEVEERFGARPQTFQSLEDAVSGCPDLSVLDIVVAGPNGFSVDAKDKLATSWGRIKLAQ